MHLEQYSIGSRVQIWVSRCIGHEPGGLIYEGRIVKGGHF